MAHHLISSTIGSIAIYLFVAGLFLFMCVLLLSLCHTAKRADEDIERLTAEHFLATRSPDWPETPSPSTRPDTASAPAPGAAHNNHTQQDAQSMAYIASAPDRRADTSNTSASANAKSHARRIRPWSPPPIMPPFPAEGLRQPAAIPNGPVGPGAWPLSKPPGTTPPTALP